MPTIRAALLVLATLTLASAHAEELRGRVVAAIDGDTMTIVDAGRHQYRIRLADIDAPEKGQPFAQRSKQALAKICFGREAVINHMGLDRYGRIIGRVRCAGIDANAEQVRLGMAWVFDRYATDAGLYAVQHEAKALRRGLWRDPAPIAPWLWRAQRPN